MKKGLLIILGACTIACTTMKAHEQPPSTPAVFSLNIETLEKNRTRINNKDAELIASYKLLIKDADKALEFGPVSVMEKKNVPPSGSKHDYMSLAPYHWPDPSKPNGLPYMRKDGQTNPEVKEYKDKEYMPQLCEKVHTLALAWYFSSQKMYAEHAAKLLRVWFIDTATRMNPNLNYAQAIKGVNTGRGAGMIDARHFVKLIDAIGLIQDSKAWTADDQKNMQQWVKDFLHWMQTSPIGRDEMDAPNNHGAWYDALRLSLALYINDKVLAKKIVQNAQVRLDTQMNDKGRFPREMERTTSLHYSTFVMDAFVTIAQMSDEVGIDMWKYTSPSGKSIRKAFDEMKPYLTQEKKWDGEQIKDFEFDEGYMLLMEGQRHFNCKDCIQSVKTMAGDKASRLRINLFY
jgi:hypothetical protein